MEPFMYFGKLFSSLVGFRGRPMLSWGEVTFRDCCFCQGERPNMTLQLMFACQRVAQRWRLGNWQRRSTDQVVFYMMWRLLRSIALRMATWQWVKKKTQRGPQVFVHFPFTKKLFGYPILTRNYFAELSLFFGCLLSTSDLAPVDCYQALGPICRLLKHFLFLLGMVFGS